MSILNRASDGLLSVLLSLRRALVAYGPQPEARLLELCAPVSVVPDGKASMARKTLTRWKQLGFFLEVDDRVRLHPDVMQIDVDDLGALRCHILRRVLAAENNPLLNADPDAQSEKSLASDCSRALAWALSQDPYSFQMLAGHKAVEALETAQNVDPRSFRNDTRWPSLKEWAPFLGLAVPSAKGLVMNPAFALGAVLSDVFAGSIELPQASFFTSVAAALPVVDKGRYFELVQSQIGRPWTRVKEHEVSPALSVALLTLEARGDLRLEVRSDAAQRILLGRGGRELRPVSHVVRLGVP